MSDDDDLRALTADVLRRSGVEDLGRVAGSSAFARLEPDLDAVLRLRLGLDRDPIRGRTRREVAEAMGFGGARLEEMIAAIEEDAVEALGAAPWEKA